MPTTPANKGPAKMTTGGEGQSIPETGGRQRQAETVQIAPSSNLLIWAGGAGGGGGELKPNVFVSGQSPISTMLTYLPR